MTAVAIVAAITEVVKLLNFYHANMPPAEAQAQAARWAKVLDFLFRWLDKADDVKPAANPPAASQHA